MTRQPLHRRAEDHDHHQYWMRESQYRFEDRVAEEIRGVKSEVQSLNTRITLLMGAIGLLAFILPIAAPFIRSLIGVTP